MIDIIIPAYNSHKTIIKTLSSISSQINREDLFVTIVNDGGKDYKEIVEIFSPILNIQEIGYKENKGPGYARQYGIDNTNNEYIIFIDADDTFYDSCSIHYMTKPLLENKEIVMLISPFIQLEEDYKPIFVNANIVWLFGHTYRRDFLDKYNIRFTETRSNEDVGFNTTCAFIARYLLSPDSVIVIDLPTYAWHYNKNSITRKSNEYKNSICMPGYVYNVITSIDKILEAGVKIEDFSIEIYKILINCYIQYNIILRENISDNYKNITLELLRKLYHKYYNKILMYISKEDVNNIYKQQYIIKQKEITQEEYKIELDEFLNLIFSSPPVEIMLKEINKMN